MWFTLTKVGNDASNVYHLLVVARMVMREAAHALWPSKYLILFYLIK